MRELVHDVAQPLRYKVSFLINHIREQTLKAASEINSSMVSTTESDGIFTVQSSNSSSTYTVDFSIPSCQCLQFKRTALPCKHFMGIFLHVDGWDWSCLPDSYKNSPYFNIDADFINGLLVDHPTTDDSFVMITEIPSKKPDENTGSLLFTDCNESTNRITKSAAADVRELLSSIRNLTYLVEYDKLDVLESVQQDLQNIKDHLLKQCPKAGGFLIESTESSHLSKNPKKITCPTTGIYIIIIICLMFILFHQ